MRKLATIQTIKRIIKHPNADTLEIVEVLGWKCVVKINQFKENEKCVYFEIDSLLPIKPEFEFLRKECYKKNENGEGFRIRTIRLRQQISQGICFPLSILPKGTEIIEGLDVTELLGVIKYEPVIPACIAGLIKGSFPSFMPKTDETRCQVLQPILTRYKGIKCYVSEKVDGSSGTFYLNNGEFGVCSRNLELKETADNAFWNFAREAKIEEKLRAYGKNIALQGEIIGLGVQKNPLKLDKKTVLFFNAIDIDRFKYFDFEDFIKLIKELELETVPILETDYLLEDDIPTLLKKAEGFSIMSKNKVHREGIVIRPLKEIVDMQMSNEFSNGRLSFKAINNQYLLKVEE